ncbi:MAG: UDP-N-acetylmuramoyl-tripeptide--D-alanyl-D-alanine ligase [Candidatus Saccharimonas sp.]
MFKRFVLKKLQKYVRRYFTKHPEVKLIAVVGSVGKTSTKRALADILSQRYRVRMHEGNHNTEFSVPLAILGINYPAKVHSPLAWLAVFRAAALRVKSPADVDVVVQELGTDKPGDIQAFGGYLVPDLAFVTAVTPEHMEFFGNIDAVAQEELSISQYARFTLINRDDVEARFAAFENSPNFSTYGTTNAAEYHLEQRGFTIESGYRAAVYAPEFPQIFEVIARVYGEHSLRPVVGAIAGAAKMGLTPTEIANGVALIKPVPGRMNLLRGIDGTTIIDDTYNSSPAAASSALQTLYSLGVDDVPQRIAVFGDMRELGTSSQVEHEKLGALCDPNMLAWVVTVGPESEKYLAPMARQRGCQVHVAANAIAAGEFVRSVTEEGAMILVKGSQNTIYLEECVKILCDMTEDAELVRQSESWMRIKNDYFSRYQ